MGDKRNYAALDWVIGEIGETLKDARQSLEAYVEDSRDTARIRFCLTHIHQVHGSLQMVEFHGASLFAEEMELLAEAIMNGQVTNDNEAHEALMRSLLQLPLYLEQVKTYHEDHPSMVLPLLNDLRAVRKQSYLSETNLFNPDLASLSQIRGERHPALQDKSKLKQIIRKLREMYQYAAASVLRGIKIDENLAYIEKVFTRLEGITRGTACHPMWQASAALIEALARDDVELSIAVRGLLRYLARELKILEEHCPAALDAPARENLLRNILYYVARAEDGGPRVAQVKQQYGLDNALLGGGSTRVSKGKGLVSPPEPDAVKAVVLALQDELNTCKHLLNLALSGQGGISDLEEMLPYVKRISDTLAVLGIGELRKQTMAQYDALALICQEGDYKDGALLDIAGGLADIENRLEAIAKGVNKNRDYANVDERKVEVDSAKEAVLSECRAGLDTVKNAIVESMSSQWDPSHLPAAVDTLHYVQGGLNMVPLVRPAAVLEACGQFIRQYLLPTEVTPTRELQILAEAIASIDYFLERLEGGHGDDLDIYLDMAEASLAQLDFGFSPSIVTDSDTDREAADALQVEPEVDNADELTANQDGSGAAAEAPPLEPTIGQVVPNETESAIAEVEPEPLASEPLDDESLEPTSEVLSGSEVDQEEDGEESDIDAEIIEIFVEEADEVMATLAEFFPVWRDNMNDEPSLATIRRAFHTLKGSGRMVEAYDVGELAWAIENMLNRVIDGTSESQKDHAHLIERVLELIPGMVEAFKNQQANPSPEEQAQCIAWAQDLIEGRTPTGLSARGQYKESTPTEVADTPAPEAQESEEDDNEDQALWDIFASEANTHLHVVDEFVAEMDAAAPLFTTPTDDLQRALHTLKGSAHMAAVTPIATMITPLEGFIKELRSYQLRIDDDILQLLKDAATYTREGLSCIDNHEPVTLPKLDQFVARIDELCDRYIGPLVHMREQGEITRGQKVDPTLLSAFMSQDMDELLQADRLVRQWQTENAVQPEQAAAIHSELGQLYVVAAQANLPELQQLAELLGQLYAALDAGQIEPSNELFDALAPAHETLLDMLDQVAAAMTVQPVSDELQAKLESFLSQDEVETGSGESESYEYFDFADEGDSFTADDFIASEESNVGLDAATAFIGGGFSEEEIAAAHDPDVDPSVEVDSAASEHLSGAGFDDAAASVVDDQPVGSADHEPEAEEAFLIEPSEAAEKEAPVSFAPGDEFSGWQDELDVQGSTGLAEQSGESASQETINAQAFDETAYDADEIVQEVDDTGSETDEPDVDEQEVEKHNEFEPEASAVEYEQETASDTTASDQTTESGAADVAFIDEDDFDPDILEIFLEEAGELIEELDEAIHSWESDWSDRVAPETMKRALHTLKGGARLSGLKNLGELTHDYETYLIATGDPNVDEQFFRAIHAYQDNVLNGVRGVRARLDGETAPTAQAPVPPPPPQDEPLQAQSKDEPAVSAEIVPFVRNEDASELESGLIEPRQQPQSAVAMSNKRQGPQEMIKVSADLLEELVNLAGETSISRGRLEQQVSDLSSAVDEVDGTLRRMNEQLRRLDLETDAQVLFRQEQMAAHEGFDPLEMDRYSQLQQLTRSLMESASDLGDLKITLADKIKDTETLLLQQSRINSALQEGLMRSRMVPFSRMVPRLRRIVRQVSGELGKHVNFELDNVEGEMDRSVLERMVAPLEHMLRNAVDHGIELPHERLRDGKPETGRILLSLAREGGDILLRMADDGRGIHLDRVREKAIERGLMTADAELSDHDVMQFILQAGFSTAENVTQISGRGVGMDVVAAEIKQLGGSIVIDSKTGVGTQFTVRLPFTVSVNRALMVQLGADMYAIPLNTIEGIVRVSPFELEHYYEHPDARFEYAGENYQVRHLSAMLNPENQPKLAGQVLPLPVILVRSAQHTMALQVDGLLGSREIVVKSLGPQFAAVQGLSGATVMGDGSVVVILDPHALVRRDVAQSALPTPAKTLKAPVEMAPELKTIMVVDDSVTVRKVTSRFLERQGYNVVTAKDGVDALQILQEEIPDLMLLDIEMPRMDGFEVAKNIRSTRRLKHLPIIMITSRTGDKHRQHAFSIGVDEYMGKPYQEEALLRAMQSLLAKKQSVSA